MSTPAINTEVAERTFAVANTPLFLLRKLQADPAVMEAARTTRPSEVLKLLRRSLAKKPKTLSDLVKPYMLLVVLSMTGKLEDIREAAKIESSAWDWYSYLVGVVIESYRPTTVTTIQVPNTVQSGVVSSKSSSPVLSRMIKVT